jgi:BlaI family transcriptional regulator, penicillinase repressor
MNLTKGEEQIMQILWSLEKGFIKDILENFEDPKPAYTTVATIVKILERKGFVGYRPYGNAHQFFPLISKKEYSQKHVNSLFKKYFKNSIKDVVSYFADNNKINVKDIDEAISLLNELKKKNK